MAENSFIQRNLLSGREVIYADQRQNRPHLVTSASGQNSPEHACPFCPGNEAMLPDILWEHDDDATWQARAVSNLYPIVSPPHGHHEIIIDTPEHTAPVGALTTERWESILTAYSARLRSLSHRWSHVSLFRNVGARAGGSIEHPHSQLIALAQTPSDVEDRQQRLQQDYQETGHCLLCQEMQKDDYFADRIVTQNSLYVAFAPEIAEVPFEIWVAPFVHSSEFFLEEQIDRSALAETLSDIFNRLTAALGEFDHNMILMDARRSHLPYLHWFLRLCPISSPVGGFERATGIAVNESRPGEDAATLRHIFAIPDLDTL